MPARPRTPQNDRRPPPGHRVVKPEAVLVPLGVLAVSGWLGWALGRAGRRRAGFVLVAGAWGAALVLWLLGLGATGWDALGWMILLIFVALPAGAGVSLGLWLGLRGARP